MSFESDYQRMARAIRFITDHVDRQPDLQEVAAQLHLSPYHFQRMFSRWAGLTPKRYLQVLTVERAKGLLSESRSMLTVSQDVGLSSASRLYDHFVQLDAVTPGEYKRAGEGVDVLYGIHDTPFGQAFIAATMRGICRFAFLDDSLADQHVSDLHAFWPRAVFREDLTRTAQLVQQMFSRQHLPDRPLSLFVSGTNFQVSVWRALLQIPPGCVASYTQVANAIGRPASARAVGLANGANPIAFLIPCHRVIQSSGHLGGYHWGETRKHAIHAWEAAAIE